MRRGGWAIHMVPGLGGSYEEGPPSLTDLLVRDRRWCQGNLQHVAVLPARGLHWVSRLHLLTGIGSYVTAPMWLLFLLIGVLIALQARFVPPEYFSAERSLFPQWPAQDPVRSMWVFVGTMGVLLVPKLLSLIALVADRETRRGCGGGIRASRQRARGDIDRWAACAGGDADPVGRGRLDPPWPGLGLEAAASRRWSHTLPIGRPPVLGAHAFRLGSGRFVLARRADAVALDASRRSRDGPCHPARRAHRQPSYRTRLRSSRAASDSRGTATARGPRPRRGLRSRAVAIAASDGGGRAPRCGQTPPRSPSDDAPRRAPPACRPD